MEVSDMTTCKGVAALPLEKRVLDYLREKGFTVADKATDDFFAGFSLNPDVSEVLMLLVSSVIELRKAYFTDKTKMYTLTEEVYVLRAQLEEAGVNKEMLNDLIGKIRELTPRDSMEILQGEEGRP